MRPRIGLVVFCFATFLPAVANAALVGITGGRDTKSILYELDPNTGAVLRNLGDTGLVRVNAIAFDPITGDLFMHENVRVFSDDGVSDTGVLWSFDLATMSKTKIGETHIGTPDIVFDSSGNLYGWLKFHDTRDPQFNSAETDFLVSIDPKSGQATRIGSSTVAQPPSRIGLAFDQNNDLILKGKLTDPGNGQLYKVDTTDGSLSELVEIKDGGNSISVLAFDENNLGYTVEYGTNDTFLQTIDLSTGTVTSIGSLGGLKISALAFTPPGVDTGLTAVPEPTSALWLLGSGFAISLSYRRRRLARRGIQPAQQ